MCDVAVTAVMRTSLLNPITPIIVRILKRTLLIIIIITGISHYQLLLVIIILL